MWVSMKHQAYLLLDIFRIVVIAPTYPDLEVIFPVVIVPSTATGYPKKEVYSLGTKIGLSY